MPIILTGAAGFIGSCMLAHLNSCGVFDAILSDDFSQTRKLPNLAAKRYHSCIDRQDLPQWLAANHRQVTMVIHLGARTDTTETDTALFDRLNLHYTQRLWQQCAQYQIPLLYASSAATYGGGEHAYSDDHDIVAQLQPLNAYGHSKNDFDRWALQQNTAPPHWYGVKFFNVYGPNEYHKKRMASVVLHGYQQIQQSGSMRLFRSHRPDFADGEQLRDFVYVKDVVQVCWFLLQTLPANGLYNIGTGKADSFLHLAEAVFAALQLPPNIQYVDIPADIRQTYQYFTEANMQKLRNAGYTPPFYTLQQGIADYVEHYLVQHQYC